MSISRRRLASLAVPALGLPLLAAACSSPEPALYTVAVRQGPVLSGGPRVVQLRDLGLASYLDRKEVVRSSEGYKLGVASNDWWGETLSTMLSRVIVVGLSQRLPDSSVYSEAGAILADPNAIVSVNIQRLDLDAGGALQLLAQAAIEFNRPKRSAAKTFRISKAAPSANVSGQVAAISDAIGELTDGLAALLRP
ncbi:MAG: membrane integrity-associated transporter subunit PqiC [Proteobacteria bacterium]|nr:membrane integrity-associated transporter subunit PqiC [Pseudomonadota bacterium]